MLPFRRRVAAQPTTANARCAIGALTALATLATGGLLAGASPAAAGPAADARSRAEQISEQVAALAPRVERALTGYQQALVSVSQGVTTSLSAQAEADAARATNDEKRQRAGGAVRAVYMAGGPVGLISSVLEARDPADLANRMVVVQRVLSASQLTQKRSGSADVAARHRAQRLGRQLDRDAATADVVARRYERLAGLLASQQQLLSGLDARARSLEAAQRARRAIAAERRRQAAVAAAAAMAARPVQLPVDWTALYHRAAATCPGLPWNVLAAIGQVETGHGTNTADSSAGARGPMQFLPSTFAAYAVDGDRDGAADIDSPADSVFTAAHYLCANRAGEGGPALERAIWHYNHADWYVQLVLSLARAYATSA